MFMPNGCKRFCKIFEFCLLQIRWMFPVVLKNFSFVHSLKPLYKFSCSFFGKTRPDETFKGLFVRKFRPLQTRSSNCITNNRGNFISAYFITCNVANGVTGEIQFV